MKLFREDKIVLNLAAFLVELFLISSFANNLYAQIPINGFCESRTIETGLNHQEIYPLDFNNDSFGDLFVFSHDANKFSLLKSESDTAFTGIKDKFFFYPITDFIMFKRNEEGSPLYLLLSREQRLVCLTSITEYGTMLLLNQHKFDSYPSRIIVTDIDKDGEKEALVSGENFDGISVIREENFVLEEEKILVSGVYSKLQIFDMNYDSYPDIVAVNRLENSFSFFINNQAGEFEKIRSMNQTDIINDFVIFDLNNDLYSDIVTTNQDGFKIMIGDSVSSFRESLFLSTSSTPDDFVYDDFNNDGNYDIAFLNKTAGELYLTFSLGELKFSKPVLINYQEGLESVSNYYNENERRLVVLSNTGKIKMINKLNKLKNFVDLALGGRPTSIEFLSTGREDQFGFCFVDSYNNTLNVLVQNDENLIGNLYQQRLSNGFSKLNILKTGSDQFTIGCYSPGERLIELFEFNLLDNLVKKSSFYSNAAIFSLFLDQDSTESEGNLILYTRDNNTLEIERIERAGGEYNSVYSEEFSDNVLNLTRSIENPENMYYWRKDSNLVSLHRSSEFPIPSNSEEIYKFTSQADVNKKYPLKVFNSIVLNKEIVVSLLWGEKTSRILLWDEKNVYVKNLDFTFEKEFPEYQLAFCRENEKEYLFIYSSGKNVLHKIEVLEDFYQWNYSDSIAGLDMYDYFIDNFQINEIYIMFTGSSQNCISIKRIE